MGFGLKLFWGLLLSMFVIGFIYLAIIGVPSPAVDVRKKINIEKRLR